MSLARILATGRFPRAALVSEIIGLAELCKATAAKLEGLAEHAAARGPWLGA